MIRSVTTDWVSVTITFTDGKSKTFSFQEWIESGRAEIENKYNVLISLG